MPLWATKLAQMAYHVYRLHSSYDATMAVLTIRCETVGIGFAVAPYADPKDVHRQCQELTKLRSGVHLDKAMAAC